MKKAAVVLDTESNDARGTLEWLAEFILVHVLNNHKVRVQCLGSLDHHHPIHPEALIYARHFRPWPTQWNPWYWPIAPVKSTVSRNKTRTRNVQYFRVPQPVGRDSAVGIATRYRLDGPESNPYGGRIFQTRPDRPETHLASCKMCTGSLTRGQSGGGVALTTHSIWRPC